MFFLIGSLLCCFRCFPLGLYSDSGEVEVILAGFGLGSDKRVDAAMYQTALDGQNADAVLRTRCRCNGVNFTGLVDRTEYMVPA